MTNLTVYRENYKAPNVSIHAIHLDFDLQDKYTVVRSTLDISRLDKEPLLFYGEALELLEIQENDSPMEKNQWRLENGNLIIDHCKENTKLSITTRIYPHKNSQLSGLYQSHSMFCTQCEAQGFRRITFFPDRPDVLTTFTTRIVADKTRYPVLLSNGNLIDKGEVDQNRHFATWYDPFKKPSYLFALVAGSLTHIEDQYITQSGRKVVLKLFVEAKNIDKCDFAMQSLKKAMQWDEKIYGREYDLDIFMIVAVSDFNMGAMENKGLNIFNTKYILARPDTATDTDFMGIEGVVAHEYFHNWTGNRVTCRDWFQLSLKEGLTVFRDQEFSRDMNSRDVNRIGDVNVLRAAQFPEDVGSMAHPVRPESYEEINNFYTATVYNKGAEVIRMQHTLLGEQGFRKGMDLYFERHDGQAVTIDDFVKAMEDANQVDLGQFKRWYSQAGTPIVKVVSKFSKQTLSLTLTQHCEATPECKHKKPFHIPIRMTLFNAKGEPLPLESDILELKESEQTFTFGPLNEQPLVSLLRDFSAPVQLDWPRQNDELIALLRMENNGFAKWDAAQQLLSSDIRKLYHAKNESKHRINENVLNAFKEVSLDTSTSLALKACLLTVPEFETLANQLQNIDAVLLERSRQLIRTQLAQTLLEQAQRIYETLWNKEDHSISNNAFARRKLRNACLAILMHGDEQAFLKTCETQFKNAQTMSDQMAAFVLLVNAKNQTAGAEAIAAFEHQWGDDELVMDKWFSVQACAAHEHTLDTVKQLLNHPAFSYNNPNKIRALIGAFCSSNPLNFHAADGSGYRFLEESLLNIDTINSQISARLATPFTRIGRYCQDLQANMQQSLLRLEKSSLSKDLREIVYKTSRPVKT